VALAPKSLGCAALCVASTFAHVCNECSQPAILLRWRASRKGRCTARLRIRCLATSPVAPVIFCQAAPAFDSLAPMSLLGSADTPVGHRARPCPCRSCSQSQYLRSSGGTFSLLALSCQAFMKNVPIFSLSRPIIPSSGTGGRSPPGLSCAARIVLPGTDRNDPAHLPRPTAKSLYRARPECGLRSGAVPGSAAALPRLRTCAS
jgi:hypothetical protein